jgi:magnesium chelatase family protein
MGTVKSHARVLMRWSPNIKSEFLVRCWIVLIRRSRIEVPRVDYEKLSGDRVGEASESIRSRVQAARDIQLKRFSKNRSADIVCNADMRIGEIRQFCKLQDDGQSLMRAAMSQLNLSARAYHRIQKLARTIADLAGCEEIQSVHLAEALQYRPKLMLN